MIEQGAISLCRALHGKYLDVDGRMKEARGDMTKLRWVPGLSGAAQKLLQNIEHVSQKLPGTQEVRLNMRFELHSYRVKCGVPIFVTFSPDEAHNYIMLKFSRVRRSDAAHLAEESGASPHVPGSRTEPVIGEDGAVTF